MEKESQLSTKTSREKLTDSIKNNLLGRGNFKNWAYSTYLKLIYKKVLGVNVKKYKEENNIPDNGSIRKYLSLLQLKQIEELENKIAVYLEVRKDSGESDKEIYYEVKKYIEKWCIKTKILLIIQIYRRIFMNINKLIPGFRSGKSWKIAIASVYYFICLVCIASGIDFFMFALSLPFMIVWGIEVIKNIIFRKKHDSIKNNSNEKILKPLIIVLVSFLMFMGSIISLGRNESPVETFNVNQNKIEIAKKETKSLSPIEIISSNKKVEKVVEDEQFLTVWLKDRQENISKKDIDPIIEIIKNNKKFFEKYIKVNFYSFGTHENNEKGTSVGYLFIENGEFWFKNNKVFEVWEN